MDENRSSSTSPTGHHHSTTHPSSTPSTARTQLVTTPPEEVERIIHDLYQRVTHILQEIHTTEDSLHDSSNSKISSSSSGSSSSSSGSGSMDDITQWNKQQREPLWIVAMQQQRPPQNHIDHDDDHEKMMLEHHRDLFQRTIVLQQTLREYVDDLKIIRAGTLHRYAFVALVGMILQIYSLLPATVEITNTESIPTITTAAAKNPITLFTQTLELRQTTVPWLQGREGNSWGWSMIVIFLWLHHLRSYESPSTSPPFQCSLCWLMQMTDGAMGEK